MPSVIFALVAVMLLWSCGDDTQFRVTGTVEGLGTRYITMYYTSSGAVHEEKVAAIDGRFDLYGNSPDYTLVELFHNPSQPLGRLVAKNGQTIKCTLDIDSPYVGVITGNATSEEWSRWVRDNSPLLEAQHPEAVNAAVADFVGSHPGSMVSTMLMLTTFRAAGHEAEAARLMASIDPKARPERLTSDYLRELSYLNQAQLDARLSTFTLYDNHADSMVRYYPSRSSVTMLIFSGEPRQRRDTVIKLLSPLTTDSATMSRLRIVEVDCSPDSTSSRREQHLHPAPWSTVWVPGGPVDRRFSGLEVPQVPYYIVASSRGETLYRGASLQAAADSARIHSIPATIKP